MKKQKIFITGATGTMGSESLKRMVKDIDKQDIIILALDGEKDREALKEYMNIEGITIHWGDLTNYDDVYKCVSEADIVLYIGAFVSPAADYHPKKAMQVNYLSTKNIIDAIKKQGREDKVKVVYIGTVAETGDRMPPIHWGRVGDPIKPSMFDYYAVSKIAAERLVIESGLKYWVSLRQTGIMGPAMTKIKDPIMFHNCLDCAFEYVSDRDSGRMIANLYKFEVDKELDNDFWCHIYNIGGGEKCRIVTIDMYKELYRYLGVTKAWNELPDNLKDMGFFDKWDKKVWIDHGYDETKPECELDIDDIKGAAQFRGGECLAEDMEKGNWSNKLKFKCAFGHEFMASPRLVLEGGHWCPECERKSWNYSERAKKDKFFAQVWNPLHSDNEKREYPKIVSELDL